VDDAQRDVSQFVEDMEASPTVVKTASPSPELFMESYKDGDSVFVVTLSSKLSGTYQNAILAKKLYLDEYGKKFIHVFDSLIASVGEGLIAQKILECAKRGLSNLEIVDHIGHFIQNMRTYFILEKFDSLVKSGRMNPYIAKVASVLNIKPICGSENGEIKMYEKTRGYNKAIKRLVEMIKENTPDLENRILGISHVKCIEKALAFKDEVLKNLRVKDVFIVEASGLVASYANKGGVVIAV
jgi:DegV family protein with EDD domain